jgi:phosphohistidine swiveling domain-containing protein
MTEWLLSGHNTQETVDISRPMTMTLCDIALHGQISWFISQLAGGRAAFDPTLRASVFVQSHCYLNVSYFARNVGMVLPFDPGSLGAPADQVPAELGQKQFKLSLAQRALIPWRFLCTYSWAADFCRRHHHDLHHRLTDAYWQLRQAPTTPLDLIWLLCGTEFYDSCRAATRAYITMSMCIATADSLLRQRAPQLLNLFAGQSTTTSLMGQRVWELCQIAKACGPRVYRMLRAGVVEPDAYVTLSEAGDLVDGIQAFLREYGHRGFRFEGDVASERLSDHPEHILLAIAAQLEEKEPPEARAAAARQTALQALRQMNPIRRLGWAKFLQWSQQIIGWREMAKSIASAQQATFGLVARHLAQAFYPDQPEDVTMFYTIDELLAFARSRGQQKIDQEVLDRRRAEYNRYKEQPPLPELIWYNPDSGDWRPVVEPQAAARRVSARMVGIGANSGGQVEGTALVTNDPFEAGRMLLHMTGPVVLVTRLTDPAWSGLFRRLSAVVTELGGVVSHAAIVARENGLPAIVSVPGVTLTVRSGQQLRVDSTAGTVEILG